jgi:Flp pilus assembly protein TadD
MARRFGFFFAPAAGFLLLSVLEVFPAQATELRITIPGFSRLTPVQQLNREGVEAARRHQVEKAQALFYKAYLFDPTDPFTLNNLGYAAELQGDAEKAQSFYALAEKQDCDAAIDISSLNELKGKPMYFALQDLQDTPLRLNRMNVEAIELLIHHRAFEAEQLMQRALVLDPHNPFTLNNLAVAEEATGDLEAAARHYYEAAYTHSTEAIIVTPRRSWRGRPISAMAAEGQQRVQTRLAAEGTAKARATMLSLRGVTAANANDWASARQDFLDAYALDPTSAFTLNNLGYISEKDGDEETAQFYYSRARRAGDAADRVGIATRATAQGERLATVASDSKQQVDTQLDAYSQQQRLQTTEPELIPRGPGATPQVIEPQAPNSPPTVPRSPDTSSPQPRN